MKFLFSKLYLSFFRYLEIFKSDGAAFEAFKLRSQNNIVPLKALAQSGPDWGPGYGGGYGYGGGGGYGYGLGDHYGGGYPFGYGFYSIQKVLIF
jgi:hypothetical protein